MTVVAAEANREEEEEEEEKEEEEEVAVREKIGHEDAASVKTGLKRSFFPRRILTPNSTNFPPSLAVSVL